MAKMAKKATKQPQPAPSQDADWSDGKGVEDEGGAAVAVQEREAPPRKVAVPIKSKVVKSKPQDHGEGDADHIAELEARLEASEEKTREAVNRMQELLARVANGTTDIDDTLTARANSGIGKPKLGELPSLSTAKEKMKHLPQVVRIRLYSVPNKYQFLVDMEEVDVRVASNGKEIKHVTQKKNVWKFKDHRCDVPEAEYKAVVDSGKYQYGGGHEWMTGPDLADEIKRNTREGARFMERMYKKSVYANKSNGDSELNFAMAIHMELKELGLL